MRRRWSGNRGSVWRQRIGLLGGVALAALLLGLPAPSGLGAAAWRTAAVGLLMAVWWMTEAAPIPVTSLLPLVLFPLLGVSSIADAAEPYANPLVFLFLGGFLIALGIERWGLHRRIALSIIGRVGTRPSRIVAGFMVATAFLSMWISNTATTLLMLPIALSIVELAAPEGASGDEPAGNPFALSMMLGVAYAASIGGMGTLIGSPTNALLAGFLVETGEEPLTFLAWLAVGVPVAAAGLLLTFVVLTRWVFPLRGVTVPGGADLVRRELERLGPMSRGERTVAVVFAGTALLWVVRPLVARLVPGLTDTGIALAGAMLLFVLPVDWQAGLPVLEWGEARRLPWGVLLLFGGGLSLADAVSRTGLADWIGEATRGAAAWPLWAITLLVVVVIVLLTELTSNTATAATFLPVVASIAAAVGAPPPLLLYPATLAASCAFMMPVATPPNAIVYGSGHVSVPQMVRAGLWLNLLFVGLLMAAAFLLLPLLVGR